MAITKPTSRRRVLQSFGYMSAAGIAIAVPPSPAAAAGFAARPTARGSALLRMIAALQRFDTLEVEAGDEGRYDDSAAWGERSERAFAEIEAFGAEIIARPIECVGDLVDRAILAAWVADCPSVHEVRSTGQLVRNDRGLFQTALISQLLALAGIRPEECSMEFRQSLAA